MPVDAPFSRGGWGLTTLWWYQDEHYGVEVGEVFRDHA